MEKQREVVQNDAAKGSSAGRNKGVPGILLAAPRKKSLQ